MAGDSPKSIPSWQRAAPAIKPTATPPTANSHKTPSTQSSSSHTISSAEAARMAQQEHQEPDSDNAPQGSSDPNATQMEWMTENAAQFLKNPKVKSAPQEKKLAFLETKGVDREVGQQLMAAEQGAAGQEEETSEQEAAEEPLPQQPSFASPPQPVYSVPISQPPPIITYPEFLAKPAKRPPLVTTETLQKTGYITAGLVASMYALSKLVLDPMAEALTEARHDFLTHAEEQVTALADKVTPMVSTLPKPTDLSASGILARLDQETDAVSEADSDPTELYHRDIGTQTSPIVSRRASLAAAADSSKPTNPVLAHESRLKSITQKLSEYQTENGRSVSSEDQMSNQLQSLTEYLNDMRYANPYFSYKPPGSGGDKSKEDEIERVRADIRGIKGVLLSTRNFPRGQYR